MGRFFPERDFFKNFPKNFPEIFKNRKIDFQWIFNDFFIFRFLKISGEFSGNFEKFSSSGKIFLFLRRWIFFRLVKNRISVLRARIFNILRKRQQTRCAKSFLKKCILTVFSKLHLQNPPTSFAKPPTWFRSGRHVRIILIHFISFKIFTLAAARLKGFVLRLSERFPKSTEYLMLTRLGLNGFEQLSKLFEIGGFACSYFTKKIMNSQMAICMGIPIVMEWTYWERCTFDY